MKKKDAISAAAIAGLSVVGAAAIGSQYKPFEHPQRGYYDGLTPIQRRTDSDPMRTGSAIIREIQCLLFDVVEPLRSDRPLGEKATDGVVFTEQDVAEAYARKSPKIRAEVDRFMKRAEATLTGNDAAAIDRFMSEIWLRTESRESRKTQLSFSDSSRTDDERAAIVKRALTIIQNLKTSMHATPQNPTPSPTR